MWIGDEKMAIIYNTGNKKLNFMIDTIGVLLFISLVVILIGGMFNLLSGLLNPKPVEQTDFNFMLNPYLGIPFFFWFCSGVAIMLGFTFHGFILINVDSHNKNFTKELDKK